MFSSALDNLAHILSYCFVTKPAPKLVLSTVTNDQAQTLIQFHLTFDKVDSFEWGKICNCLFG